MNRGSSGCNSCGTALNGGGSLIDAGVGSIAALDTLNDLLSTLRNTLSALLDVLGRSCDLLSALLNPLSAPCNGTCAAHQLVYTGEQGIGTADDLGQALVNTGLLSVAAFQSALDEPRALYQLIGAVG